MHHPTRIATRHGAGQGATSSSAATLSKAFPDEIAARRAVEAMQALGVARRDIRLLTCRPPHDTRGDQVGGWAGPVGPNAPVGTYGGGTRLRRQGTGTYAGDSDEQRQGSWADVDRVVIVSFEDEGERSRVAGLRGVGTLLRRAELDDDAVERALGELRVGHPVVLVSVAANASNDVRVELEQGAQAA